MNIVVRIQLGLGGLLRTLPAIWLDSASVGGAAAWSGSYHVLRMAEHYDDYVITGRILALPVIAGIPPAHPYQRLTAKIRAAGVTGNIGECTAALFARRYLGVKIGDIAHTRPRRPFRRRRAPDYLMRIGANMPGVFQAIVPNNFALPFPMWWPVESKARNTEASTRNARRDALRQLVAYWTLLRNTQPSVVGFGMIITFTYQPPRELRASLFLPANQPALIASIQHAGENIQDQHLFANLHGC
jgi:hypothetical protein